jgi:hypothetical protein
MADREQEARDCAARRREREAHPPDPARCVCRCDHDHPPEVTWCDLCENPVERELSGSHSTEPTVSGGNGAPEMVAPDGRTILGGGGAGEASGTSTGTAPGGAGGGVYWDPENTHIVSGPLSFTTNGGASNGPQPSKA